VRTTLITNKEQAIMDTELSEPTSARRLWEIDALRGIAVVAMIVYHLVFDLHYFGVYSAVMTSGPWQVFARSIGSTFILLLGVSLTLRQHRLPPALRPRQRFTPYLRRGLELIGWGLVITMVTYFLLGPTFVIFGILHLLGLATILAYPFLGRRWTSLLAGLMAIAAGIYLNSLRSADPWLLWLGVRQVGRAMVDYYPVLPWFGLALLGVFAGQMLYPNGRRHFALPDLAHSRPVRGLAFLGRHSLPIYLIHQPILFGLLILLGIGSI
jgi:uncharacterized membrane protein